MTEDSIPTFHSTVIERAASLWRHHELNLGIRGIDAQHAWLVAMVMQLEYMLSHEQNFNVDEAQLFLEHARAYTVEHFRDEEVLYQEMGYSDEVAHTKKHQSFIKVVEKLNIKTKADADKLYRVLRLWLVNHILAEDKSYATFFTKRKLLDEANKVFDNFKPRNPELDQKRFELLDTLNKGSNNIQVTNPQLITEISSTWKRLNLAIGVPLIDIQHLWLIKMIVDMDDVLNESQLTREAVLSKTLQEARDYIEAHFRTEEQLMDVLGFKAKEAHIKKHNTFEEFVKQHEAELQKGDLRSAMTVVSDLKGWLTNHIAIEDKAFATLYKERKQEALEFSKQSILSGKAQVRQSQLSLYEKVVKGK